MSWLDSTHVRPADCALTNTLIFSSGDDPDLHYPHNDPLVVTLTIANYSIKWVLIDIGSSSDILFTSAFDQLKISKGRLQPMASPLVEFNESSTQLLGIIKLPVLMGTHLQ